jgi:hypothetical protein
MGKTMGYWAVARSRGSYTGKSRLVLGFPVTRESTHQAKDSRSMEVKEWKELSTGAHLRRIDQLGDTRD